MKTRRALLSALLAVSAFPACGAVEAAASQPDPLFPAIRQVPRPLALASYKATSAASSSSSTS